MPYNRRKCPKNRSEEKCLNPIAEEDQDDSLPFQWASIDKLARNEIKLMFFTKCGGFWIRSNNLL
jgi:hypothetical protein